MRERGGKRVRETEVQKERRSGGEGGRIYICIEREKDREIMKGH